MRRWIPVPLITADLFRRVVLSPDDAPTGRGFDSRSVTFPPPGFDTPRRYAERPSGYEHQRARAHTRPSQPSSQRERAKGTPQVYKRRDGENVCARVYIAARRAAGRGNRLCKNGLTQQDALLHCASCNWSCAEFLVLLRIPVGSSTGALSVRLRTPVGRSGGAQFVSLPLDVFVQQQRPGAIVLEVGDIRLHLPHKLKKHHPFVKEHAARRLKNSLKKKKKKTGWVIIAAAEIRITRLHARRLQSVVGLPFEQDSEALSLPVSGLRLRRSLYLGLCW